MFYDGNLQGKDRLARVACSQRDVHLEFTVERKKRASLDEREAALDRMYVISRLQCMLSGETSIASYDGDDVDGDDDAHDDVDSDDVW